LLIPDGKTPKIGTPHVAKAFVSGEVVSQDKKDKVYAIQFRRRKDSKRIVGHRRLVSSIYICVIWDGS
jgi:ribosomal protein L21